jgi:tetratricopeptide (TPR) repeat protein
MTVFQSDQISSPMVIPAGSSLARWLGVAVAAIAILAFCPILSNGFITLDDGLLITRNPDFNPPTPSHWMHYWTGPKQDEEYKPHELYMPITNMVWGMTAMAAQTSDEAGKVSLNAGVFHGVSLILHAINAVLVFLVLRKLVPGDWPAFFGALLFAVHPLQTESVAWAAETSILLSGMFSLAAILLFLQSDPGSRAIPGVGSSLPMSSSSPSKRNWFLYSLATLSLALALLSKAPAVVVPAIVVVLELLLRRRKLRTLVIPMAIWGLICLPIVFLTSYWQISHFTVPIIQRPIVAADALAFYLYKLVLPISLLPNYGRTPIWLMAHRGLAATTWLAPAALAALCVVLWRKIRWVAVSALIFAVALLPVLGLTVFVYERFSTTADRYVYLAMLGPALALASLIALWPRVVTFAISGVIIAVLAGLSLRQTTFWADSLALFTRVIEAHPDSQKGQEEVAVALGAIGAKQHSAYLTHRARGDMDQAMDDKRESDATTRKARAHYLMEASLPDDRGAGFFHAANCCLTLGEKREAIGYYQKALADPTFEFRAAAYNLMGKCYMDLASGDKRAASDARIDVSDNGDKAAALQHKADYYAQEAARYTEAAFEAYTNALKASETPGFATEHKAAAEHLRRLEMDRSLDQSKATTKPAAGAR